MIGLYCPDLPPVPGGVADHTLTLARAFAARGIACTVLGHRGDAARFPVPVRLGVTPDSLAVVAKELGIGGLLVQYVPFLYARRGVAPGLCGALGRLAGAGVRHALFVHEPYVPFTRLPWLVTGVFQRRQLRCLVRGADLVYTPVPAFADICRRYGGRGAVTVVPIGATVAPSALSREEARAALRLEPADVAIGVFSPAAAGYLPDWVRAAIARLADRPAVRWIAFGFGSERLFEQAPPHVTVLGALDPAQVADTARALDLFVAPYGDGLTLRRSGAMLGLMNGLPIVSSTGHLFDASLAAYAACEPDRDAFVRRVESLATDAAARAALAARAREGHGLADTGALADRIARDLAA